MIVDLALKFTSTVRESEVLSILRGAAKNAGFEDLIDTALSCLLVNFPRTHNDKIKLELLLHMQASQAYVSRKEKN